MSNPYLDQFKSIKAKTESDPFKGSSTPSKMKSLSKPSNTVNLKPTNVPMPKVLTTPNHNKINLNTKLPTLNERGNVEKASDYISALGYGVRKGIYNAVDEDKETKLLPGLMEGFKASFDDTEQGDKNRVTTNEIGQMLKANGHNLSGDILSNPIVGFAGDIVTDPTSFVGAGLVNNVAKKGLAKVGVKATTKAGANAIKYGSSMVANGGLAGGISAGKEAYEGGSAEDVLNAGVGGFGGGAVVGASSQALGDVFSHVLGKLGKVKVTGETNGKVDYVKEDGSTGTMSKVIFDKEATPTTNNADMPTSNVETVTANAVDSQASTLPTIKKPVSEPVQSMKPTADKVDDEVMFVDEQKRVNAGKVSKVNDNGTVEISTLEGNRYTAKKNGDNYEAVLSKADENTVPIEDRMSADMNVLKDKSVKPYQELHPELKGHIQQEADVMLGELKRSVKGERQTTKLDTGHMETKTTGLKRMTSSEIASLRNDGHSYEDIERALNNIIKDGGSENTPLAKKVESLIDMRLSKGYQEFDSPHSVEANTEYLNTKNRIEGNNADMSHPAMGATNRTESMQDVSMGERPDDRTIKQKIVDKGKHLYKIGVDVFNTGKDFDETTYIKMINSKKVGGTVTNIYEKDLVDMQGNVMGESLKSIAKDLPADLDTRKKFMKYVLMKHNIDRAREGKNVFTDFDSEGSSKAVAVLEKNNPEWKALNDRLVGFTNKFMGEWGNNSGLISDDLWDELNIMYKNYVPTQREFSALEKGVQRVGSGGGKGFVDTGNTLKKAQGSDRDIKDPMENIMNLVNKVTRTARYNEVGQSMLAKLKSDPEGMKKYAEIIPDGDDIDPNVENIVTVIDKGQPVYVKVNDIPFLESLKGVYKDIELDDFENLVAKFGQGFKNLITTDNPFFAIFNGARDIPTAYIFGSEGNPAKFAKDYISAMVDIVRGGEGIRKYKAVGGEMGNYFAADETAKAVEGLTKEKNLGQKALQGIRGFNNAIEDAPRLAEFNRALKNGDDVQTALYKAGEVTTNFSRGGSNVRKLDKKGVPYLNASVQGIDRFARAMKNDTGKTITRSAVAITLPTVALNLINWDNDNYKALDNRTKDTYYCIPNIADGGETFIKLPKSRETGVIFGALTERIIRQLRGEDNAFKDMGGYKGTVANNFLPVNPLNSNLAMPLINAYATNTDFAGRKIVPQGMKEGASLINQYDETTSEIGKLAAQLTQHAGLGPKQVDYLLKSYTGVIAQFVLPAATKNSYKNDNGTAAITKPIKTKFVADPAYSNQAITDFYDNFDTLNRIAGDYNLENDIPSKDITVQESYKNRFAKISKQMTELSKAAKNATSPEEAREYRKQMIELAEEANSILPTQSKSKLKKEFESGRLPMLNNKTTSKK